MPPYTRLSTKEKLEKKRSLILAVAWEVFAKHGYSSATIEEVAIRANCSKSTIYTFFSSKEELLMAVLGRQTEALKHQIMECLEKKRPCEQTLQAFGMMYLKLLMKDELLEAYRLAIAESRTIPVGAVMYNHGFVGNWRIVGRYLQRHFPQVGLDQDDGWTAAMRLRSLLESDFMLRRLWGVAENIPLTKIRKGVKAAIKAFMAIYT